MLTLCGISFLVKRNYLVVMCAVKKATTIAAAPVTRPAPPDMAYRGIVQHITIIIQQEAHIVMIEAVIEMIYAIRVNRLSSSSPSSVRGAYNSM